MLSIFTPTHRVEYLDDAYDSLKVQDYEDWEWVIVPNGKVEGPVPEHIMRDPRVRTAPDPKTENIGALKKHACDHCLGDAFVELDSDDMLMPGVLGKITAAIADGAGFVYSDAAVFNDGTLDTWAYHEPHGWESYPVQVYDKVFLATKCFDITPRSLCEVYYAPDHVRVWSREAYEKTGGHNPAMEVADDHDLMCRTYLAGFKFHYLGECGYLYRFHDANTVKSKSPEIRRLQNLNRQQYFSAIAAEWTVRQGLQSLDLGPFARDGNWTGGTDLPFEDSSIGHLIAFDCLQFLAPEHQVPFFNEAYRVLAPSGVLHVAVPHADSRYPDQDPRFLSRFNGNSFLYYSDQAFSTTNPDIDCRFQIAQLYEGFPQDFYRKHEMKMLFGDLCALKGQRQPAPQNI
jgi:glycosyltransferase involved in cell wall biosynthesis